MELAARIGQSLLKKNRTLTEQNDYLEERVGHITEEVREHLQHCQPDSHISFYGNVLSSSAVFSQVAQLHHELNLKDELLQFYTSVTEESEDESSGSPKSASFL